MKKYSLPFIIKRSPISGIGVFTTREIIKGAQIRFPGKYREITKRQLDNLHPLERDWVLTHCIPSSGKYPVPIGGSLSEFCLNHQLPNNVRWERKGYAWYATRKIAAGEELTMDYSDIGATHLLRVETV